MLFQRIQCVQELVRVPVLLYFCREYDDDTGASVDGFLPLSVLLVLIRTQGVNLSHPREVIAVLRFVFCC
jgi:hypothetical protein